MKIKKMVSIVYMLSVIIFGELYGGHYYAYCKMPNSKWYCFDDKRVEEIPANSIVTPEAYMLFYVPKKYEI